jgi:outer membrane protein assembly factor BamB
LNDGQDEKAGANLGRSEDQSNIDISSDDASFMSLRLSRRAAIKSGVAIAAGVVGGLVVGGTAFASGELGNTPWPMFQHDPQHTGQSPYVGTTIPAQKWKFETMGAADGLPVASSPAISQDGLAIYIGSDDGHLYALDDMGQNKVSQYWVFPKKGAIGAVRSSPAIAADGTVYVGSFSPNNLYSVNPTDGSQNWVFTTGVPSAKTNSTVGITSPVIDADGLIYFGSADGHLYKVLDRGSDAKKIWQFPAVGEAPLAPITSSAALSADGSVVYIGCDDNNLYAVDTADGTEIWNTGTANPCCFMIMGPVRSSPTIDSKGFIYVGSDDNNVYAINPANGVIRWVFPTGGVVRSTAAISRDGGTIYIGSKDTNLYAINTADGSQRWVVGLTKKTVSSPMVDDNGVIFIASFNSVYAIVEEAGIGSQLWEFQPGGTLILGSTALGRDGTIYLGSSDGNVYAILSPPSAPPVPEFGAGAPIAVALGLAGLLALRWRMHDDPVPGRRQDEKASLKVSS